MDLLPLSGLLPDRGEGSEGITITWKLELGVGVFLHGCRFSVLMRAT